MRQPRPIRRDVWLAALDTIEPPGDQAAKTLMELRIIWDCTSMVARRRVEKLLHAGKAVKTLKRLGPPLRRLTTAYRLKD